MSFLSPHEPMFFGYEDHHFQGNEPLMRRSMSYSGRDQEMTVGGGGGGGGGDGETSEEEEGSQLGEKKRRLNLEQVKALEKSFEIGNKLEPDRKRQLARALGLQPRQVAIWFQNRRARWKTKQLERDYNVLKKQVDSIKADNVSLKNNNQKLRAQLMAVKGREPNGLNLNKETEGSWSNNGSETEDNTTLFYTQISHNLPTAGAMPYLLRQPLNHQTVVDGDEGFCNMLNGMEEQPAFWPWPEAEPPHPQL